ncbi:MAG TPA: heavy metal-responsive transcriptional regulator [Acidimicrobiia bacterium]|jgi:DNA-binding transcriptional MerR regulator
MRIGELADRTGTTAKTVRYYEEIGLLPEPDRGANDYRDYSEDAVDRLSFIRDAQATGLTLTEIASILDLRSQGETTCHHVIDLLERHMTALDKHIKGLRETRKKLASLTEQARNLNPADCVDPNRCQTISHLQGSDQMTTTAARHLHEAPAGHHH